MFMLYIGTCSSLDIHEKLFLLITFLLQFCAYIIYKNMRKLGTQPLTTTIYNQLTSLFLDSKQNKCTQYVEMHAIAIDVLVCCVHAPQVSQLIFLLSHSHSHENVRIQLLETSLPFLFSYPQFVCLSLQLHSTLREKESARFIHKNEHTSHLIQSILCLYCHIYPFFHYHKQN